MSVDKKERKGPSDEPDASLLGEVESVVAEDMFSEAEVAEEVDMVVAGEKSDQGQHGADQKGGVGFHDIGKGLLLN